VVTSGISEGISKNDIFSIFTNNSTLLGIFLFGIGFSVIFKIISITLMVVVFNYGRKQLSTDKTTTKKLTSDNSRRFQNYETLSTMTIFMTISLLCLLFTTYATQEVRIGLKNILGLLFTLGILGFSSYEMFIVSRFYKIYNTKGMLYEISSAPPEI
jgi:hypothetical protein